MGLGGSPTTATAVEARPGTHPTFDELTAHVRKEIAGYKVPKNIWLVDKVHRLATGKADYRWANDWATEHPGDVLCAPN